MAALYFRGLGPESDLLCQCPVYDLDNNVAFTGMYQTMTKKGAVTVQVMHWPLVGKRERSVPAGAVRSRALCSLLQRKDFPSSSFYVVVVVKTEDEACGGPLRFYPLRPDELIDAGNRTKVLDVVVSPAIDCECWGGPGGARCAGC